MKKSMKRDYKPETQRKKKKKCTKNKENVKIGPRIYTEI